MEDTLYELVIGSIEGSKHSDMSHVCASAVTRSQANRIKGNLRFLIRL